jgi:hypothetical protein
MDYFPGGKLNRNIKSVIIDVVLLWILVVIGGLNHGLINSLLTDYSGKTPPDIVLFVNMSMLIVGFCISAFLVIETL